MTKDGSARCLLLDSTDIVNRAIEIHGAYPMVGAALGRVLTAASLMGSLLGDKTDLLTVRYDSLKEESGLCLASSDYMGNVRGFITRPAFLPPVKDGKIDLESVFKNGDLFVLRDLEGKEPYTGIALIEHGDISSDIAVYYAKSEQIPTLCVIGVNLDKDFKCVSAGGLLIQLLPYADESIIDILENNTEKVESLTHSIKYDGLEKTFAKYLDGIEYDLFDSYRCDYVCHCSREKTDNALLSLGKEELLKMAEEPETELSCQFCDKKYNYSKAQLCELAERAK